MKKKLIIITSILLFLVSIYIYNKQNNSNTYKVNLSKFERSNNNTNAASTTKGINDALLYAKNNRYTKVVLPKGIYAIDTSISTPISMSDGSKSWTQNAKGIVVPSGIELILTGCTLQMIPTDDPYYSVISISNTNNTKITGGTILGDRDTHDYGHRINSTGTELELGSFDNSTGNTSNNDNMVRTKNYIDNFNGNTLPNEFYIIPLENTTKNTVDGGVRYIYCYDSNNNYLGIATGSNGFISKATLLPNTAKIKISFKDEKRLDAKYFISNNMTYFTHEFGNGINITASNNTTIDGTTIKDMIGDCITTFAPPVNVTVDNLKILNCTLENSRRQGISFVATGENYLVQGCNIGNINGVDPQAGIDIENYNYIRNIVIDKSNFYNNRKLDIINYNGNDIEIKNSNFDGTIGSTYGWNMNIHDNEMIFKNSSDNPKLHNATFILNTNKTDDNNAYFKIDNNIIKDYPSGGSIANLALSEFTNNKVYNTKELNISSTTHSNYFENSSLWYSSNTVTNEIFNNSTISIKHTNLNPNFNNCQFNNSLYRPALTSTSTIKDSTIINNSRSFGDTSAWWDLRNTIVFDNCDITTKYTSNIPFLNNHASNTFFRYCRLNLSRYTFCVNYGGIEFDNCDISFNNLNTDSSIVDFDKLGTNNKTNYWKFDNCTISSELPLRVNSNNLNNNTFQNNIILN